LNLIALLALASDPAVVLHPSVLGGRKDERLGFAGGADPSPGEVEVGARLLDLPELA
jgi:hypothetical protein